MNYEILLYYKYTPVNRAHLFVEWHKELCKRLNLKGRILIADEGINGTVEGLKFDTDEYCRALTAQDSKGAPDKYGNSMNSDSTYSYGDFSDVIFKRSPGDGTAFPKMRIKLRSEIVTLGLGQEDVKPTEKTGTHLKPEELKKWFDEGKKFHIVDMRNDYEFISGHFKNSINPKMDNFRDLPKILPTLVEENKKLDKNLTDEPVLSVCTGGVRCEKASAYLMKQGFKEVYQLDGGIVSYMEKYPGQDFVGSLYVFDNRITMSFDHKVAEANKNAVKNNAGEMHEIIGRCAKCNEKSERYVNCANDLCHLHFICCENCISADGKSYCPRNCTSLWRIGGAVKILNQGLMKLVSSISSLFSKLPTAPRA